MKSPQHLPFILAFLLVSATTFLQPSTAEKSLDAYRQEYDQAEDEAARIGLCVKAINDGVIAVGEPVENIDKVLDSRDFAGKVFSRLLPEPGSGVIFFNKNYLHQKNKKGASGLWTFRFSFDSKGKITDYKLRLEWLDVAMGGPISNPNELAREYQSRNTEFSKLEFLIHTVLPEERYSGAKFGLQDIVAPHKAPPQHAKADKGIYTVGGANAHGWVIRFHVGGDYEPRSVGFSELTNIPQ